VNVSALNQVDLFPKIAVDTNGNAAVVWYNSTNAIQGSSKPFGGAWEVEQTLSQLPIALQFWDYPAVAMDGHGNATAVWAASSGTRLVIQASTKPFGAPWQEHPDTLSADSGLVLAYNSPQIAIDSNGNITVVWATVFEGDQVVQASIKPFGEPWQPPVTISRPGVGALYISIAVDRNGNVTVVWFGSQGSNNVVQASTKPLGQTWQEPTTLTHAYLQAPPQIAIDSHGNAIAVWVAFDGTNHFIQSSTKLFNQAWQETPDILPGSQNAVDIPRIGVDSMGNATVVWSDEESPTMWPIRASTKPFGSSWQTIPDVLFLSESFSPPQIAVDSMGNATVIWMYASETTSAIQASTKPFGGEWQTTPDVLSLPGQQTFPFPQIAVDGSGNATAVWSGQFEESLVIQSATKFFGLTVTSVRPTSGPKKGGNTVTITGTNFVDVASVYFGSTPSQSFTIESPTTILAIVPPGKGTVDVTVTASSRTSPVTPTDLYTYRRFKGKVKHHKNKLFVKTKWNKSAATVTGYEIFARKKKIATIPAQNKAQATIRLHPHHAHHEISNKYRHYVQHKYKVRAIDVDGTTSAFTFVDIHR
jgi:hypothetical protein